LEEKRSQGNTAEYTMIYNKMTEERKNNEYINGIMQEIDKGFNQIFAKRNVAEVELRKLLISVKEQFDSFFKDSKAFTKAKKGFDDLAKAIQERDIVAFKNVWEALKEQKKKNSYIAKGMQLAEELFQRKGS
jgi:hypothetical protein